MMEKRRVRSCVGERLVYVENVSPGAAAPHHFLFHLKTREEDTSLVQSSQVVAGDRNQFEEKLLLGKPVWDGAPDVAIWTAGPRLCVSPGRGLGDVRAWAVLHPGRLPGPVRSHHHRHVHQGEVLQNQGEGDRGQHLQRSERSGLWRLRPPGERRPRERKKPQDGRRQRHLYGLEQTYRWRI